MGMTARRLLLQIVDKWFVGDRVDKPVFVVIFHRNYDGNVTHKDIYPVSAIHFITENRICVEQSDKIS